ncbi:MAG: hypothetical protein NC548_22935 [Lachnospiraceae bacterium]|nr:hypothetical protein [Lachnospiraceae bacterium]
MAVDIDMFIGFGVTFTPEEEKKIPTFRDFVDHLFYYKLNWYVNEGSFFGFKVQDLPAMTFEGVAERLDVDFSIFNYPMAEKMKKLMDFLASHGIAKEPALHFVKIIC